MFVTSSRICISSKNRSICFVCNQRKGRKRDVLPCASVSLICKTLTYVFYFAPLDDNSKDLTASKVVKRGGKVDAQVS